MGCIVIRVAGCGSQVVNAGGAQPFLGGSKPGKAFCLVDFIGQHKEGFS